MSESARSWTSRKLDWLRAINFDGRVSPLMFKIAFCIIQHANEKTARTLLLSDETIADEIGTSHRNIYRPRTTLREIGWLNWRRTRNANIYTIEFKNVDRMLDGLTATRDQRNERRKSRENRRRECAPTRIVKPKNAHPRVFKNAHPCATDTLV
jgi:hypothetical protein